VPLYGSCRKRALGPQGYGLRWQPVFSLRRQSVLPTTF
jgi:hypothetical protein